uniref:Uncharacterized protein n=1 Tax=Arundo donax TaxID=35708 RepID=A0A0A8YQS3_ARUDO
MSEVYLVPFFWGTIGSCYLQFVGFLFICFDK